MLKSGQAAMEFLMTYGWAILAVLISIAALAYFGVLNPSRFLPQSCTLFPGIACTDVTVNNAGVSLVIQNGLGQNLNPFTISIPGCSPASAVNGLSDGEKETIALPCNPGLTTNSRFKNDIDIAYTPSAPGISHTRKGSIVSQVENGYILNGGFESDTNYWSGGLQNSGLSVGTGSIDSTTFMSGSNSFKAIITTAFSDYPLIAQEFNAPAGTYVITYWAKANSGTPIVRSTFRSTELGPTCGLSQNVDMGWKQYTNTCIISGTDTLVQIYFGFLTDSVTYWIDDIEIKKA